MGPVRLGVGTEWLLDGRAFRVVRQLTADRFIAQDVKFLVEQEFSQDEILAQYSSGRLQFATSDAPLEARKPLKSPRRTVRELDEWQKRILEQRWQAMEPLTRLATAHTWRALPSTSGPMEVSLALLLHKDQFDAFRLALTEFRGSKPWLEILCTGPWPPYSYVSSD